jgi:hypothetical protein
MGVGDVLVVVGLVKWGLVVGICCLGKFEGLIR